MEAPTVAVVVSGTRQQLAARGTGSGKGDDFVRLKVVEVDTEDDEEKDKLEHTGPTVRWHRSVPLTPLENKASFLDTMDD